MSDERGESHLDETDGDEVPESQVPDTEHQSSCDTFMSQQSENEELSENPEDKDLCDDPEDKDVEVSDIKSADTSAVNSSLEANTSGENVGGSHTSMTLTSKSWENAVEEESHSITDKGLGGESEGDLFQDEIEDKRAKPQTRKRKVRSDESTPSLKKIRKNTKVDVTPDKDHSVEVVEHSQKTDLSVMEISSTPEKTITIEDSQEFSLRIEDSSPSNTQCSREKRDNSQIEMLAQSSWESHKEMTVSPAVSTTSPTSSTNTASCVTASQSQKSNFSWSSHTQNSWISHKYSDDLKVLKEDSKEHDSQASDSEKELSGESCVGKPVDSVTVMEPDVGPVAKVIVIGPWVVDSKNKVLSVKIKRLSLVEDHPSDKPGRMSMVSTTSAKSSTSTGSVGLPGPFPLPGRTVGSRLSTVSSASSASSNLAWDGPFLKPQVPGSKLYQNIVFSCEKCGHNFPVDRFTHSSPVVNGSPPVNEEVAVSEVKPFTTKRGRKLQASQASSSASSGPLEEETESSGSHPMPPQASSTPTRMGRGRPRKQNGTAVKSVKKEVQPSSLPARTPRAVGRGARNGTANSAKTVEKAEGQPVLARWGGDGRYYPGWVAEPLSAPQMPVQFCDGQRKSTPASKVVRAEVITPGTLVLAATSSGDYEEALVVRVDTSGAEPVYMVERDKSEREVQFASIALQQSVVMELTVSEAQKVATPANFNDLSLENIIVHPRKRSARTPVHGGSGRKKKRQTTPQPCTSHGQTYNGPDETYGDTDSSTHSSCSLDLRGKEIKPLDVECFPPETTITKLAYNRGNMAFKKKGGKAEEVVARELGPIPKPGSNLFTDCGFLITYTDTVELHGNDVKYSSADDTNGISLNLKLWRDRLRLQIRNGGGKVYNSFSEVTKEDLPDTYLITDKQCNTPLYLQCLVNNVPIYPHSIVIMCCAQNRTWKEVIASRGVKRMLAGYSLSRRCLVNPRSLTPLRNRNLLLALSGDPSLSAFWESLITKAGGSVDTHPHGILGETKYDAVVTDSDCDRELVAEACRAKVPLVSMTWLQQVIITGEWRPPTEHPLYKYNSCGYGEDSPEY